MSLNLANLELPVKVLFSGYLGVVAIGCVVAVAQLLASHGTMDGKPGLSLDDIAYSYYANRSDSLLENKLNGTMSAYVSGEERLAIVRWMRAGADQKNYAVAIEPVIQKNCIACHNRGESSRSDLSQFSSVLALTKSTDGTNFSALAQISLIKLGGIALTFLAAGLIFSLTSSVPGTLKATVMATPYLFLLSDLASWWLVPASSRFAVVVLIGGSGLTLALNFMVLASLYEMWVLPGKLASADRRNAWNRP